MLHSEDNQSASEATCCTYCGLPVAVAVSAKKTAVKTSQPSQVYCCYGCRFAHAVVQEQGAEGAVRWTVIRLGLAIFFTMNLMAFTMTMWSLDVYEVEPDPFQVTLFEVFRWLSMVFALPVLLLLGVPLVDNAIGSWRRRDFSTDLLIGFAVVAAYLTSVVNVVREDGPIYFEVGAMVLVMITLGRWIEAAGKQKATAALDQLAALLPKTVQRVGSVLKTLDSKDRCTIDIASADVRVDDLLRIRAGDRFPTDAVIHDGVTTVDEQVFTGESSPVKRCVGEQVLAGTVNLDGDIIVCVTAGFREGSFGRLMNVLRQARSSRGHYQRLADRIARWFLPVVAIVAVVTFLVHLPAGTGFAIQTAMAVLLIACPCALGLATPLAIWTSLSTAVRNQVLFRSGEAVERLAGVNAICLDKTGTLTTGTPRVSQAAVFGDVSEAAALEMARVLARSSTHPFSRAVSNYIPARHACSANSDAEKENPIADGVSTLQFIRTVPGGGVEASLPDGRPVRLGSVEFACCETHSVKGSAPGHSASTENSGVPNLISLGYHEGGAKSADTPNERTFRSESPDLCVSCGASVPLRLRVQLDRLRMAADQQAASIVLLTIGCTPAIGFLIAESVRKDAESALRTLHDSVEALHVLSGDRPARGQFLQDQLSIRGLHVESKLSPEQKVLRVSEIRRTRGTTVMVGDGINDAPALAASDVGIAMGCGADVSRDSAQVCLLSDDLNRIPWAIDLAKRTQSTIRQNLFWAFAYNTVGVALASTGILNPAIAAGLMIGSSLLVISNSLRLLRGDAVSKEDPADEDSSGPLGVVSESAGVGGQAAESAEQLRSAVPGPQEQRAEVFA